MAIDKKVGEMIGVKRLAVTHSGLARSVSMFLVLTHRKAFGHNDPAAVPAAQRLLRDIQLPFAEQATTTWFENIDFGPMPVFPVGSTLDVNLSIGKPTHPNIRFRQTNWPNWYSARNDDDWNDDVYKIVSVPTSSSLGNPSYY